MTVIYYIDYSIFDDCDAINELNAHRSNSCQVHAVDRSDITHAESISSVIDRSAVESMKMNNSVLAVNLEVAVEELILVATL